MAYGCFEESADYYYDVEMAKWRRVNLEEKMRGAFCAVDFIDGPKDDKLRTSYDSFCLSKAKDSVDHNEMVAQAEWRNALKDGDELEYQGLDAVHRGQVQGLEKNGMLRLHKRNTP